MARLLLPFLVLAALLAFASAASNVVDLTDANFDKVVDGSKPVFVEFFAPWCGHCKSLVPVYEAFADAFAHVKDKLVIAKVDADAHGSLGSRFGVKGFPTLKFFPKGEALEDSIKYEGGRTEEDLISFIEKHTGLKAKKAPAPISYVTVLTETNFKSEIIDSDADALVEFYAPWCGHCKKLAPEYEVVAAVYKNEPAVKVAKIDCDANPGVCQSHGVSGYPTLKWFPKSAKSSPVDYEGGRDLKSFVKYINEQSGVERLENGRPGPNAGRVADLDLLVKDYANAEDKAAVLAKAKEVAAGLSGADAKNAKIYLRALELLQTKPDYITTETSRLNRMLDSSSLSPAKIDEFATRINILGAFQ
jgi:protein disulfide-isomerase A6